jgi:hypothetical protein
VNGDAAPSVRAATPPGLVDAYEELRCAVACARRDASLAGLGVLMHRGMAAWMHACKCALTSLSAAPSPSGSRDRVHVLPAVQREVIDVLTAMALKMTPEVKT